MRTAPLAAAALIVVASLGGLIDPSIYARETPGWALQGVGQDWFDLVVLAPALVLAWAWSRRDPVRGAQVLAGALACTVYTFVIYAFAVHFNALFLVYCAVLGLSAFSLGSIVLRVVRAPARGTPARERLSGAFFVGMGGVFGALWLIEIVPALARREAPASLAEAGLLTNPVHVLDLSVVLPAMIAIGVALVRARPIGRALGPALAAFGVLMALSIATLTIAMRAPAVAVPMIALALASGAVLFHLLRAERA